MKRFARRAAAAAALVAGPVVLLAAPAFASDTQVTHAAQAQSSSAATITAYENQVVVLTNQQRAAHGCKALRMDARLTKSATAHSVDMVQSGEFSHVGSDGSDFVTREARAGYPRRGASAENIAWGFRTPADVMVAWMNSPGHRANILNCGSVAIGVGVAYTQGGAAYWTQDYGRN